MPMKVILLQEVAGLGKPGDVKTVADGYARNFLLPRQMVTAATPSALANLQERVATEQRRQAKMRAELDAVSARINAVSLRFEVRVGAQNRLYGSVTNQNIADALRDVEGILVDRRAIVLSDPLRTLGTFKVPVRLSPGVEPQVTVELVAESKVNA
jgi:large subunit ribosomal protein L9